MEEKTFIFTEKSLGEYVELLIQQERNRLAEKVSSMPFGDTAKSFAVWIRKGGKDELLQPKL
jgi:hypothetical protein